MDVTRTTKGPVFLMGASGFVGQELLRALMADGFPVRACVRRPELWRVRYPAVDWVAGDFSQDQEPGAWAERLRGCSAVINAVGIIAETPSQKFRDLHSKGPIALFQAAASLGISRILQVSALGADADAATPYHKTKKEADDLLRELVPTSVVLRPSLTVGSGALSTRLFAALAVLPVLPLPGGGRFAIQPLRCDDLVAGVIALLRNWPEAGGVFDVTGPEPTTLRHFLADLRSAAGFAAAWQISVPMALVRLVARWGRGPLNPDALSMLERGNVADQRPFEKATGIAMQPATDLRAMGISLPGLALPFFLFPLRLSIAALWIWTAVVSAFFFPAQESYVWLRAAFVPEGLLALALYGASALDLILGVLLFTRWRSQAYLLQLILVSFYTILISFALPSFLLHPFGPLTKNLPLLAATFLGWVLDREPGP